MTKELTMTDTQVAIAGAGPTGLVLVLVLERLPEPRTVESRAGGLHIRTMEVLDQRGLLDGFLERGRPRQDVHFSGLGIDLSDMATRYPYALLILQAEVERLLEERAAQLGVRLRRDAEVTGFTQDETGVMVELADGSRVRADYLVGCDGGRSTVRGLAGIEFPGTPATMTAMLGDVELAEPPAADIFQERRDSRCCRTVGTGTGC
ncbi:MULTISPECIES: FAD-dependent monooxygenase [unclassified Nonomuraea]|uniref:FAD-dependent monooxygenase n=1 Tax=unclassified Nonomuraea TaxID=2593643 RepID=UPI003403F792